MPSRSFAPSESSEPSQSSVPSESPSSSSSPTTAALQAFKDRCESTSGLLGSNGFVDCVGGFAVVNGVTTSQTCVDACDGKCCFGSDACGIIQSAASINRGFTGKGEQRVIHNSIGGLVLLITYSLPFISFFLLLFSCSHL